MSKQTVKRRRAIIRELSDLSRDGWRNARRCDYHPLERELREIEERHQRKIADHIDGYDRDDLGESPDF